MPSWLVQVVVWGCFDAARPPASDWHPLNAADPWAAHDLFVAFVPDSVLGILAFHGSINVVLVVSVIYHPVLKSVF